MKRTWLYFCKASLDEWLLFVWLDEMNFDEWHIYT
jgi:hypothetical protein